ALKDWRFPNANIVYGDAKGTISYSVIGAIPLRPKSVKNQGRMAYPVTTSDRDWIGFIPYRFLPQVTNPKRGYLISANHRPIQSFYPLDIGISTGSLGDTQRSWRLRELLERKNSFIPEEILEMHYDMVNPVNREILRLAEFLRYEQQIPLEPDSIKALDYLHQWYEKGARSDMEIQGTELANQLNPIFRRGVSDLVEQFGGGTSGLCYFLKTRKAQMREEPAFEIKETDIAFIQKVMQNAWRSAKRQYGDDPSLWQTKSLKALQNRKLGYYESLGGFPSLDPEQDVSFPFLQCIDGGTIHSQASQSYTQWVPLHDVDQALSILPIGQTEQPADPYRKITFHQWAKGELHPAPITMEGVEKYVIRKQVLTNPQYKGTE
ncbi:hypothetical protein GF373_15310, partial [bacterium]|nr:hypothetical protein [bacterium]